MVTIGAAVDAPSKPSKKDHSQRRVCKTPSVRQRHRIHAPSMGQKARAARAWPCPGRRAKDKRATRKVSARPQACGWAPRSHPLKGAAGARLTTALVPWLERHRGWRCRQTSGMWALASQHSPRNGGGGGGRAVGFDKELFLSCSWRRYLKAVWFCTEPTTSFV